MKEIKGKTTCLMCAFLCSVNEHRDAKEVLEDLIMSISLADSLIEGIKDAMRLPGIENIPGGVLSKHCPVSHSLLLTESNQQTPN